MDHEKIAELYIKFVAEQAMPSAIPMEEMIRETQEDALLWRVKQWLSGRVRSLKKVVRSNTS